MSVIKWLLRKLKIRKYATGGVVLNPFVPLSKDLVIPMEYYEKLKECSGCLKCKGTIIKL